MNWGDKFLQKKNYYAQALVRHWPHWIKPNHFTILRLLLLGPLVYLILNENYLWFLLVFVSSALTDVIDGALARAHQQKTTLGVFLDPVADRLNFFIPFWLIGFEVVAPLLVWLLLFGEAFVFSLAWFYVWILKMMKTKFQLGSNIYGKIKGWIQVLIIPCLVLYLLSGQTWLIKTSEFLIGASLFCLALSLFRAIRRAKF